MCGCPSRLKRMRSIALASVAVPTVERGLAPIRSWSTMIAVVSPSSTSTSGRASVGMKPCTKALYVSLISRCDSAAIVPNTSELLPEPETPVKTVNRRFGSSTLRSLRLFTRAPCTRIRSWRSATSGTDDFVSVFVFAALLISSPSLGSGERAPSPTLRQYDVAVAVAAHFSRLQLEQDVPLGGLVACGRRDRGPHARVVDWVSGTAHRSLAAGPGV